MIDDDEYNDTPEGEDEQPWRRVDKSVDTPKGGKWPGRRRRSIDGPQRGAYLRLRAPFKRKCRAEGRGCAICEGDLGDIDYEARGGVGGDPLAFEVDHLIPLSTPEGERLALEVSLWRASHALCNRRRLNAEAGVESESDDDDWMIREIGTPSEAW